MPFVDDVALRPAVAAPLVDAPQPVVERLVRRILEAEVERSLDGEPLLVQLLRAEGVLEVLADLLDEERSGGGLRRRLAADDDRPRLGCIGVGLVMYRSSAIRCST